MNIDSFISKKVIMRDSSMFLYDISVFEKEIKKKIFNKKVLVIGGAGSIGSAFIKQLLQYKPSSLVVVDINENALTELTRELRSTKGLYLPKDYLTYPFSYCSNSFKKMFVSRGGFDIVANFSAHKHVRTEKDIFSVEALIYNNVIDAKGLLDLLTLYPPQSYFCVSTDKAANPTNIMGASKRIMEDLIFCYSANFKVTTARFANVAFSNGSLLDGFLRRIPKLQPLCAPSDIKRYFVSPEESGQICLLACVLGNNREIFFPKLKEAQMMKFDDIALSLLKENGYSPVLCDSEQGAIDLTDNLKNGDINYPVFFSPSDTSGEKQYEEFYIDGEKLDLKRFKSLGVIIDKETPNQESVELLIKKLITVFDNSYTKEEIVNILESYLPNFKHIETNKSLDSKM